MQPKFIQKEAITLAGLSFYGDPFETSAFWSEENQIGRLWQRLLAYFSEHPNAVPHLAGEEAFYEVHVYGPETMTKGLFEVFVGVRITEATAIPVDLLVKRLPANEYAVFTLEDEQIATDWHLEIGQWIADAGCQSVAPFNFQYYDSRFKGLDQLEGSQLDVYMPVKKLNTPDTPSDG